MAIATGFRVMHCVHMDQSHTMTNLRQVITRHVNTRDDIYGVSNTLTRISQCRGNTVNAEVNASLHFLTSLTQSISPDQLKL